MLARVFRRSAISLTVIFLALAGCAAEGNTASPPVVTVTPSQTPTATPTDFTISGSVLLNEEEVTVYDEEDDTCILPSGYQDLPGAQVTVTDEAGTVLALGELDTGVAGGKVTDDDGEVVDLATNCTFDLKIDGVPDGGSIYGVEVASRGVVNFRRAQLDAKIELTLG